LDGGFTFVCFNGGFGLGHGCVGFGLGLQGRSFGMNYFIQGSLNLQGGSSDSSGLMGDVGVSLFVFNGVSESSLGLATGLFRLANSLSLGTSNLPLGFSTSFIGSVLSILDFLLGSFLGCLGSDLLGHSILLRSLDRFLCFLVSISLGTSGSSLGLSSGSSSLTFGLADLPVGNSLGFFRLSLLLFGLFNFSSLLDSGSLLDTGSFLYGNLTLH